MVYTGAHRSNGWLAYQITVSHHASHMVASTNPQKPSETSIPHPSKVLFPLGLGTALSLMGDATLYTVLPTHTAEAGFALSSVGVILGVNRAVRVLTNGPAGLAYDRHRRRRLFVPALFVGALSTAIYATTHTFWPLFIGRLLWGLAWSGIWVGGATIIMDITTPDNRGRWTGLYQTWFYLGAALGAFVGGLLTDKLGYSTTMWIGAVLTTCGGIVAFFLLPETQPAGTADNSESLTGRASTLNGRKNKPRQRTDRRLLVAASLQGINRFVVAGVLYATMGLLVQNRLHLIGPTLGVATLTGILVAGRTVLSMAAAPLAGIASDWLKSRWGVITWSLALGAISMVLVSREAPGPILMGITLGAVTSAAIQSLVITLTGDIANQTQRGRAIGIVHTAGDLGSAAGPPIAYALLPWVGLSSAYLLCAGLFAAGLLLCIINNTSSPQYTAHE